VRFVALGVCAAGLPGGRYYRVAVKGAVTASALKTFTSTRRFLARASRVLPSSTRALHAEADHVDFEDRDIVLGNQVLHDGVGATPAEPFVVLAVASLIGVAFDGDDVALVGPDCIRDAIEILLGVRGERVLIEAEGTATEVCSL